MSQLIQITDKAGRAIEVEPLDLADARAQLSTKNGKAYWRSLEELSEQPGFGEMLRREFPGQAPKDFAPLARRDFVKLMGAALALAGLSGCAFQPPEKIISFAKAPEQVLPGIPLFYATAMPFMGYGLGLLARSNEGRPTKVEGNPDHPASRGRTDVWAQASVLNLYDPDRSQFIRQSGGSSDWETFVGLVSSAVAKVRPTQGEGLTIVTETLTSPTLLGMMSDIQRQLPRAKWHSYEPVNRDNVREGVRLAMGRDLHPVYHFDRADVIVSLDCDFLLEEPDRVSNAREFISNRKLTEGQKKMNRLYVIESTPTITGAQADHRIPMKAAEVDGFARALASAVGVAGVTATAPSDVPNAAEYVAEIANDLKANRGRVIVCAGAHQPPAVHALAHAMTATLGSTGATAAVSYHAPIEGNSKLHGAALSELVAGMNAGRVQTILIMGANPAYSAPADLNFASALKKVPLKIHHGAYEDETSTLCDWHVPEAHYLEAWGDVRAVDGTASLVQPLVQPLYSAAKSQLEMLSTLAGNPNLTPYDAVRNHWLGQRGGQDNMTFEKFWQKVVHNGFIPGTAAPAVGASLASGFAAKLPAATRAGNGLEVSFRPDPTIWDGRFANNPWLQECPKPVSKITWDNAFFVSPTTAEKNGWATNNEATLTLGGKSVTGAIFLLPGQPDDSITVHLGYGRTNAGKIGTGPGFDANQIRTTSVPWIASGATLKKTGATYKIATTSHHNLIAPQGKETGWSDAIMGNDDAKTKVVDNVIAPETREVDIDGTHGRDVVRVGTLVEWVKHLDGDQKAEIPVHPIIDKRGLPLAYPENPEPFRSALRKLEERPIAENREVSGSPSFYPRDADYLATSIYKDQSVNDQMQAQAKAEGRDNAAHAWGMTVDLQSCIGCNACVVGCQSENNSAVVGKDQVLMGREMHWIRIDTYYRGSFENPEVYFEPMMCQHCEKAPCAPVCPFNATMNSPEGINEQVYNRCVGTKYCENNCPYKVRRFNFLQYSDQQTPVIQLMANPDVTVRSRGVMEKCTYCIQRVNSAKWQAEKEDRRVRDGEIQVACAQACPTDAIVFGDINDPKSKVSLLKRGPLSYGVLTDLNTMPRTSYLARFKNPNPALEKLDKPALMKGMEESEEHDSEGKDAEAHGESAESTSTETH
ncbi:prokaryotic molybdopterin-containing oxidoreductase family, iron-sulfur binding subunit [Abditibacterium utsteinense]|uniref:Prokaryotic molybdopterin-containing oxidoreductase family, iron-sulfur binding subunit n=1 Tax=Abditibacterium utsteinense TaxID=1960156 RepID=A0A2S8SUZ2_9BACT|nr:TAT-variant-translocated molybdopterin oxidoreductase [Abditibacterium utsteinense]PQV64627.1 prokaryotic molybdopterin-containing oxidoreductase family, iron-sulfur binding subunit [Abditibacterium utsteinense]